MDTDPSKHVCALHYSTLYHCTVASSKSATNEHTKGWGETAAYIFTKVGEKSKSTGYHCTKGLNRVHVHSTG